MARAREYLKKRKTTKINMAASLLSPFSFHISLSFLSPSSVHRKTAGNVLKNTLFSTFPDVAKLRSQFAAPVAPTSEREGRDRKRTKSQSGHGALFMVRGFALCSLGNETPEAAGLSAEGQLKPKTQPPLRDEKGRFSRKKKVRWIVRSAECGVRSAECGVRSAECGVRSAECGVRSAECGVRSAECGVWKMRSVESEEFRKYGVWKVLN